MRQLLVFILISVLLCWFMFTPVYRHVLVMRHAALQKEVDYLLEVGANGTHGYISPAMIDSSRSRLEAIGFEREQLDYVVTATNGKNPSLPTEPLLRGTGIYLKITYPYENLFALDRLIGISTPEAHIRMGAAGMKMSEYVPD